MRKSYRGAALLVAACAVVGAMAAQEQKSGNPEDHLPPNITRLSAFGERASWSPDGQRVAFMSKSFGDAFVADVRPRRSVC